MGFCRQGYWSGLPFPPPGDLPNPGIEPWSPALQSGSLLSEPLALFFSFIPQLSVREETLSTCQPLAGFHSFSNYLLSTDHLPGFGLMHGVNVLCLVVPDSATPRTVALQTPLSMGFSRQDYWSGLSCLPPGDLPNPGIELRCPTLQPGSSLEGSSLCGSQMRSLPPSPPHQLPLWALVATSILPYSPLSCTRQQKSSSSRPSLLSHHTPFRTSGSTPLEWKTCSGM